MTLMAGGAGGAIRTGNYLDYIDWDQSYANPIAAWGTLIPGVPHNRLTKIIVAMNPEEVAHLERILATGRQNGVELEMITGERSRQLEPHVPAIAALYSPNTGVMSAHGLMDALKKLFHLGE